MLRLLSKFNPERVQLLLLPKNYQTLSYLMDKHSIEKMNIENNNSNNLMKLSSEEINKRLMSFFDLPDNWKQSSVQSGIFINCFF